MDPVRIGDASIMYAYEALVNHKTATLMGGPNNFRRRDASQTAIADLACHKGCIVPRARTHCLIIRRDDGHAL